MNIVMYVDLISQQFLALRADSTPQRCEIAVSIALTPIYLVDEAKAMALIALRHRPQD